MLSRWAYRNPRFAADILPANCIDVARAAGRRGDPRLAVRTTAREAQRAGLSRFRLGENSGLGFAFIGEVEEPTWQADHLRSLLARNISEDMIHGEFQEIL
jgi:hypothetical protein